MANSARIADEGSEALQRVRDLDSVIEVMEEMLDQGYNLPVNYSLARHKDPNLTIGMGERGEIFRNIYCNLLPSIRQQITSLLDSTGILDSDEEYSKPVVGLTLEKLWNLDQILKSIVSSTIALTDRPPQPGRQHHHCLENYEWDRLRSRIEYLVQHTIIDILSCWLKSIKARKLRTLTRGPGPMRGWGWHMPSEAKRCIWETTADGCDFIDRTITSSRRPDWASVQVQWLWAVEACNKALESLSNLVNFPPDLIPLEFIRLRIDLTEERHLVVQTCRQAGREQFGEVVRLALTLIKLARVMVKKVVKMISRKPSPNRETEIDPKRMVEFEKVFRSIARQIGRIVFSLPCHRFLPFLFGGDRLQHSVTAVMDLTKEMKSTATFLASHLIPLLEKVERSSSEGDLEAWSLVLEQPWETIVDRSLVLRTSIERTESRLSRFAR
ncbi:hypothetical protein Pst134EB_026406 [Puccinia striiformis f. sp. tritici]|uniref:Uncharacterized protein n=2 Tax=Puccinia striiformis f. sp. tritici TaxID=168172 RepID=A0A0L0VXD7_9BASI|nr:hypothetical protein Pst134EB_026406 [Puccinia striiformis f. sp. tritici]KNF03685.1 hypothetical protein PSTG_03206 [Puccinia striiformis f. sp. tritici PST-78]